MLEAKSQDGLVNIVKDIKKKARFKGLLTGDEITILGIKFGSQLSKDSKYAWTNHHETISYNGELLDVKVPTILGRTIVELRYLDEKLFNESFIVRESSSEAINRESNTYERLKKEGFPTLESRQDLIKYDGELLVDNVLLTKKIEKPKYIIDRIQSAHSEESKHYIGEIAKQLKTLHDTHNQLWGDAWLGNTMITPDENILLYDFGFKANPEKNSDFLKSKDLIGLCISSVYRTNINPEEIISIILEKYNPNDNIKMEIKKATESSSTKKNKVEQFIEQTMYHHPVFGMNSKRLNKVMTEMYTQSSKVPAIIQYLI